MVDNIALTAATAYEPVIKMSVRKSSQLVNRNQVLQ